MCAKNVCQKLGSKVCKGSKQIINTARKKVAKKQERKYARYAGKYAKLARNYANKQLSSNKRFCTKGSKERGKNLGKKNSKGVGKKVCK